MPVWRPQLEDRDYNADLQRRWVRIAVVNDFKSVEGAQLGLKSPPVRLALPPLRGFVW